MFLNNMVIVVVPRILPFSFGESSIFAGQSAQVTCFVSEGDPPLDITWTFQGQNPSQYGVSTTRVGNKASMLVIDAASFQHQGDYSCMAKNPAGVTVYNTSLQVHGSRPPHPLPSHVPCLYQKGL